MARSRKPQVTNRIASCLSSLRGLVVSLYDSRRARSPSDREIYESILKALLGSSTRKINSPFLAVGIEAR